MFRIPPGPVLINMKVFYCRGNSEWGTQRAIEVILYGLQLRGCASPWLNGMVGRWDHWNRRGFLSHDNHCLIILLIYVPPFILYNMPLTKLLLAVFQKTQMTIYSTYTYASIYFSGPLYVRQCLI